MESILTINVIVSFQDAEHYVEIALFVYTQTKMFSNLNEQGMENVSKLWIGTYVDI